MLQIFPYLFWFLFLIVVLATGLFIWASRRRKRQERARMAVEVSNERMQKVLSAAGSARAQERTSSIVTEPETVPFIDQDRPDPVEQRTEHAFGEKGEKAPVSEPVTVVLRRQVPPRFNEPPRSWIGGLPMMPEDVPWPRSVSFEARELGERPLHFLAQIACEDLPDELWCGLGPRSGWLLFFLDPNQYFPEDSGSFRILHTQELGVERPVPADLGPVHDGQYSGPDYGYLGTEAPSTWRRWPVDLVSFPNEAHEEDGHVRVTPPHFAERLYAGAPIAGGPRPEVLPEPFTWRMALGVIGQFERRLSNPMGKETLSKAAIAKLSDPHFFASLRPDVEAIVERVEELKTALADVADPGSPTADEIRQQLALREERLVQAKRLDAFLTAHPTVESLLDYLHSLEEKKEAWQETALQLLARERKRIEARDLDTLLAAEDWALIIERLKSHPLTYWRIATIKAWKDDRLNVSVLEKEETIWGMFDENRFGLWQFVSDYYTDAQHQALIPPALLETYEPWWRQLADNRPHRMGGYHDGLQSEAQIGPTNTLLLLQVASDPAMNWVWGDAGVYYFWIRPDDLATGDFSKATAILECH